MTPQFVLNASDLGRVVELSRQFGSPLVIPKRLLGLGADDPPVPTWAWMTVAFGLGALLSAAYWPRVRDFLENSGVRR